MNKCLKHLRIQDKKLVIFWSNFRKSLIIFLDKGPSYVCSQKFEIASGFYENWHLKKSKQTHMANLRLFKHYAGHLHDYLHIPL